MPRALLSNPRVLLALAVVAAAGFAAGWGSMLPLLDYVVERVKARGGDKGTITNGPWSTRLDLARSDTPPPVRAYVAQIGIAAHRAEEAIYWNADADSAGRPLDGRHAYAIRFAKSPDVSPRGFWSLTVYGADSFLVPNAGKRYSIGDRSADRSAAGPFVVTVSSSAPSSSAAAPAARDWLPCPPDGRFSLTLRMYVPLPQTLAAPAQTPLPSIACIDCDRT
jgi:hypothetical protein